MSAFWSIKTMSTRGLEIYQIAGMCKLLKSAEKHKRSVTNSFHLTARKMTMAKKMSSI